MHSRNREAGDLQTHKNAPVTSFEGNVILKIIIILQIINLSTYKKLHGIEHRISGGIDMVNAHIIEIGFQNT